MVMVFVITAGAAATEKSCGLFIIEKEGKYGFIDKTGRCLFASFSRGLSRGIINDKNAFIDAAGLVIWSHVIVEE